MGKVFVTAVAWCVGAMLFFCPPGSRAAGPSQGAPQGTGGPSGRQSGGQDAKVTGDFALIKVPITLKNMIEPPEGRYPQVNCKIMNSLQHDIGFGRQRIKYAADGSYSGTVHVYVYPRPGKSIAQAEEYSCGLIISHETPVSSGGASLPGSELHLAAKPGAPVVTRVSGKMSPLKPPVKANKSLPSGGGDDQDAMQNTQPPQ